MQQMSLVSWLSYNFHEIQKSDKYEGTRLHKREEGKQKIYDKLTQQVEQAVQLKGYALHITN